MSTLFEENRKNLITYIQEKSQKEGSIKTDVPSLYFYSTKSLLETLSVIYEPSLCVILQGSKSVSLGEQTYEYNPFKYLLSSTHIPAKIKINEASREIPFVSLKITFTLEQIYEVLKELEANEANKKIQPQKGLFFGEVNIDLLNPISRLVKLLDTPQKNREFMAPLITKEILYILLNTDSRDFLKQYVLEGSATNQVAKAITEIKKNFAASLNIKELAHRIGMSESSLYHNFKKVTMLSPLQFQKKLRLEEAKQMLLNQNIDASQAAFDVGYESPSQFSREYTRMFGLPPKAHVQLLRCL